MTTNLEVFNMALMDLELAPIQSLDGSEPAHDAYRGYFNNAIRNVIREIKPKFATKHDPLSLLDDIAVPGFDYVYQRPGDALMILEITNSDGDHSSSDSETDATTQIQWSELRYGEESRRVIATEIESAYCLYIANIREASMFDDDFIDALRYRLASDCAPFLGKASMKDTYFKLYEYEKDKARIANLLKEKTNKPQYDGFTETR